VEYLKFLAIQRGCQPTSTQSYMATTSSITSNTTDGMFHHNPLYAIHSRGDDARHATPAYFRSRSGVRSISQSPPDPRSVTRQRDDSTVSLLRLCSHHYSISCHERPRASTRACYPACSQVNRVTTIVQKARRFTRHGTAERNITSPPKVYELDLSLHTLTSLTIEKGIFKRRH
jgi:hypothetical protein